jgi:hypothetical protein
MGTMYTAQASKSKHMHRIDASLPGKAGDWPGRSRKSNWKLQWSLCGARGRRALSVAQETLAKSRAPVATKATPSLPRALEPLENSCDRAIVEQTRRSATLKSHSGWDTYLWDLWQPVASSKH